MKLHWKIIIGIALGLCYAIFISSQSDRFQDLNADQSFDLKDEPFVDSNNNEICDQAEEFTDENNNGQWDEEEPFQDRKNQYFPALSDLFGGLFSNKYYEASFFGQDTMRGKPKYGKPNYRVLKNIFKEQNNGKIKHDIISIFNF